MEFIAKSESAHMKKRRSNCLSDLTQGNIAKQILFFTLPIIATGILQLLFNTADTFMVGRFGGDVDTRETALAAVGSCTSLVNLFVNFFLGISTGSSVSMARDLGCKNQEAAERTVHTTLIFSAIAGLLTLIIGLFLAEPMLTLMGTKPAVLPEAVKYMKALFCGMPANVIYFFCAAVLRASGDTVRPLLILTGAGVINIILNYVTVAVFYMGACGVGIATAASYWISALLVLIFMFRTNGPCHLSFRKLRLSPQKLQLIVRIGIPSGINSICFAISNVCVQSAINYFDKTVVAANTTAGQIDSYVYTVGNSFYHTVLPFIGQNMGAKRYDRMRQSTLFCLLFSTIFSLSVGCMACLFGEQLIALFAPGNTAIIAPAMKRLSLLGVTYFLCSWMDVTCGTLRGMGKSLTAMFISLLGVILFRIIWIFAVFPFFHTLESLYISYPISWILTFCLNGIFCLHYRKRLEQNGCL